MAKRKPMQDTVDLLNKTMGDPAPASEESKAVTLEAVQKELENLRNSYDTIQKENATAQSNLMAALATPSYQAPQPAETAVNLKDLPNPAEDAEAYAAELARRFEASYAAIRHNENLQAQQIHDVRSQQEVLWETFQEKYADYAKDPKRLSIAYEQVSREAQRKKIPLDKYMFGNSTQFMKDVVTMHDNLFGKPQAAADTDDDEDDNRTQGIFGGQESGGKPVTSQKPAEQGGSFTKSIREWQIKNGYYR